MANATIAPGYFKIEYTGAGLTLAQQTWISAIDFLIDIRTDRQGLTSFRKGSTIHSLTQLATNQLYIGRANAALTIPDASQIHVGGSAPANQIPVATAGSSITIQLPVNQVQLNGSGVDPDGTISAWSWQKTSGPTSNAWNSKVIPNPLLSQLTEGVYTLSLIVTDNQGASSLASETTVTVQAAAPVNGTTTFTRAQIIAGMLYSSFIGGQENGYTVLPITNNGHTSFSIQVESWNTNTYESYVHLWIDGVWVPAIVVPAGDGPAGSGYTGVYRTRIMTVTGSVPAGATMLRFRAGPAVFHDSDFLFHSFPIMGLTLSGGTSAAITAVARKTKAVFIGCDSIPSIVSPSDGAGAIIQMMRDGLPDYEVIYGGASGSWDLKRFPTPTDRVNYGKAVATAFPPAATTKIYLDTQGRNALGNFAQIEEFGIAMGEIWDTIRRESPRTRIIATDLFSTTLEIDPAFAGLFEQYNAKKMEQADLRSTGNADYVSRPITSAYNVFKNNMSDGTHPDNPLGMRKVADYLISVVLAATPTVGDAVYTPPVVQDAVIYTYPLATNQLDTGPNNLALNENGTVTYDATKQAAYFDGASTLSRTLGNKDSYPRGFVHKFKFQWQGGNDLFYGILAGGAYAYSIANKGNGRCTVSVEVQSAPNVYVLLTSQELDGVSGMVEVQTVWDRNRLYFSAGGGVVKSAVLQSIYVPNGASLVLGNGPSSTWLGWLKDVECIATGSGVVSSTPPTLAALTPTAGIKGSTSIATGTGFGATKGGSYVSVGSTPALALSWSDTAVEFEIPTTENGEVNVTVTTNAGTTNGLPFSITATTGIYNELNFLNSLTEDTSGNELDFAVAGATGAVPVLTADGAYFNGKYLTRPANFRDNFATGWNARLSHKGMNTPFDAYNGFMQLGANIQLITQSSGGNTAIMKLIQYPVTGDPVICLVSGIDMTVPRVIDTEWKNGQLLLSVNGASDAKPCPSLKESAPGQDGVIIGYSGSEGSGVGLRETTLVSFRLGN